MKYNYADTLTSVGTFQVDSNYLYCGPSPICSEYVSTANNTTYTNTALYSVPQATLTSTNTATYTNVYEPYVPNPSNVFTDIVLMLSILFIIIPAVSVFLAFIACQIKIKRYDRRLFKNHFLWLVILLEVLWINYLFFDGWVLIAGCFVTFCLSTYINEHTDFLKVLPKPPLQTVNTVTFIYSYGTGGNVATDSFTGSGPYNFSQTPDGDFMLVYLDNILQPLTNIVFVGGPSSNDYKGSTSATWAVGVNQHHHPTLLISSINKQKKASSDEPEPYVCG